MAKEKKRDEREASISRRRFIKHTTIGGIALAYTVGVGRFVSSLVPEDSPQEAYLKDVLPGDRVMMERGYVLMTDREKEELIQMFIENYKISRKQSN